VTVPRPDDDGDGDGRLQRAFDQLRSGIDADTDVDRALGRVIEDRPSITASALATPIGHRRRRMAATLSVAAALVVIGLVWANIGTTRQPVVSRPAASSTPVTGRTSVTGSTSVTASTEASAATTDTTTTIPPLEALREALDPPVPSTSTTVPPKLATGPCRTGKVALPDGASLRRIGDVDGDGRPDSATIVDDDQSYEEPRLVIVTAAGGMSELPIDPGPGGDPSVLIVNADERGPVEVIVSATRTGYLYQFTDCRFRPVVDANAQPFSFPTEDQGDGLTTLGCAPTSQGRRLVLLDSSDPIDPPPGTVVTWTRTVIDLDDGFAASGPVTHGTFVTGRDDAKIRLLSNITCGKLTIERDGVQDQPTG
jgi:hypothetical protein